MFCHLKIHIKDKQSLNKPIQFYKVVNSLQGYFLCQIRLNARNFGNNSRINLLNRFLLRLNYAYKIRSFYQYIFTPDIYINKILFQISYYEVSTNICRKRSGVKNKFWSNMGINVTRCAKLQHFLTSIEVQILLFCKPDMRLAFFKYI